LSTRSLKTPKETSLVPIRLVGGSPPGFRGGWARANKEPESGNLAVLIYMTVGRQHNERLNTPTNTKRRTETFGTHADILPDLRVIQYTYPLIEASRTLHHVASLDDWSRYTRVQSFPNTSFHFVLFGSAVEAVERGIREMAYTWGDATLCAGDWFLQYVAQAFRTQVLNFVYALLPFLAFCDRRKRADLGCTFGSLSGGKYGRDSGMMRAFDSRHFLPVARCQ
jgi:hypothetical protein